MGELGIGIGIGMGGGGGICDCGLWIVDCAFFAFDKEKQKKKPTYISHRPAALVPDIWRTKTRRTDGRRDGRTEEELDEDCTYVSIEYPAVVGEQ